MPSTVYQQVVRVQGTEAPCHWTVGWLPGACASKIRIIERGDRREGRFSIRRWLIVRRFCLDESHENVLGVRKLVLIERAVLNSGAPAIDKLSVLVVG